MRFVHREMFKDVLQVAIGDLQQFHQEVLDFDVVMGSRKAEPCRGFERGARRIIEFADEAFQVGGHTVSFPFTKPGLCLPGPAPSGWSGPS